MNKVLSVSIAAYNVESTLREALEPFCKCRNKDLIDVMIINDGSKDNTAKIAKEYEEKYPETFRLITKENGGWGSTLNTGFKYADGKYFKQLDGDDYFSPENLDDFILYLSNSDADMVYSPFVAFEDKTNAIIRVIGGYDCFKSDEIVYLNELEQFMPAMHDLTIKTNILKESGITITENCFYTDIEFVVKSYNHCKTMNYYEYPIYYYRLAREGQSMSLTGVKKHYKDHEKMLFVMLEYLNNHVTDKEKARAIANRLVDVCKMQYSFYCLLEPTKQHKDEFRSFDLKLKKYPYFYSKINGKITDFLREHNFNGYLVMAKLKTNRDKKYGRNFFG